MAFNGFPDEAFLFYEGLEADNSKTYFSRHRRLYEAAVREPLLALTDELADEFGTARLFRPHRDLRFTNDKSPYKTHMGAFLDLQQGIGLYLEISADGLYTAGGWYSPAADQVARYRAAVDAEPTGLPLEKLVAGLRADGCEISGDRLKTRPRGIAAEHPRLDLLRHRSLYAGLRHEPEPWVHTAEVKERVREGWRAYEPLVDWLAAHVRGSELNRERGRRR